jgi:hypothetical protein
MNGAINTVVAIYETPVQAEIAIRKMEYAELDLCLVSLLWRKPPGAGGGANLTGAGRRLNSRGQLAIVATEIRGALSNSAYFRIPGLGEVFVAGPLVEQFAGGLDGVPPGTGFTPLGISLIQLGLFQDSVLQYEAALVAGKGLVLAHGAPGAMIRTREVLAQTEPDTLAEHQSVRLPNGCYAGQFFSARDISVAPRALPKTLFPSP